jgi:hypothetical protein
MAGADVRNNGMRLGPAKTAKQKKMRHAFE